MWEKIKIKIKLEFVLITTNDTLGVLKGGLLGAMAECGSVLTSVSNENEIKLITFRLLPFHLNKKKIISAWFAPASDRLTPKVVPDPTEIISNKINTSITLTIKGLK